MAKRSKNTSDGRPALTRLQKWQGLVIPALRILDDGAKVDRRATEAASVILMMNPDDLNCGSLVNPFRHMKVTQIIHTAVEYALLPTVAGDAWIEAAHSGSLAVFGNRNTQRANFVERLRRGERHAILDLAPANIVRVELARLKRNNGRGIYASAARLSLACPFVFKDKKKRGESNDATVDRIANTFREAEKRHLRDAAKVE